MSVLTPPLGQGGRLRRVWGLHVSLGQGGGGWSPLRSSRPLSNDFRAAIFSTEAPPAENYISEYQESTGFFYHNVHVIFQPFVLIVNVSALSVGSRFCGNRLVNCYLQIFWRKPR